MSEQDAEVFKFEIGQVVLHLRYGYRGVIFERDGRCEASEGWYQKNQTQPDPSQPWYHVLVDGGDHTTYVAESNLAPEPNGEPVTHPLLGQYFQHFHGGLYHRENLN